MSAITAYSGSLSALPEHGPGFGIDAMTTLRWRSWTEVIGGATSTELLENVTNCLANGAICIGGFDKDPANIKWTEVK